MPQCDKYCWVSAHTHACSSPSGYVAAARQSRLAVVAGMGQAMCGSMLEEEVIFNMSLIGVEFWPFF